MDKLFENLKVAREFFGMIRAWHEMAKDDELWQKLRIVLVHSTEHYVALDVNQSPFTNVGLGVKLEEITPEQVKQLALDHGLDWSDADNAELMRMVGGHPHLVRVALYALAAEGVALRELLREAPTDGGRYRDHLLRLYWIVMEQPELADAMRALVCDERPARLRPEHGFKLESLGLAKRCAPGDDCHGLGGDEFVVGYDLYRKYFRSRLRCK